MRLISWTLGALALAALTTGCGGSSYSPSPTPTPTPTPTPAPAGQVNIVGNLGSSSFNPNPASQPADHMLTWKNTDRITHRIVADDGSFDTGDLAGGQSSAALQMVASGKSYHCSIHPSMVGTVSAAN